MTVSIPALLPMDEPKALFPLAAHYSLEQFDRIRKGYIAQDKNNPWFIRYEEPWLYFHERVSGRCIYQLRFSVDHDGMTISEAWANRNLSDYSPKDKEYDGNKVFMLIQRLLLHTPDEVIGKHMKATANSWKRIPFTDGIPLTCRMNFTKAEYEKLEQGFIPNTMEDKWFVYFESPYLFFHRGFTGYPVFRVTLSHDKRTASIAEALLASQWAIKDMDKIEYHSQLLEALISNLLLGKSKRFPKSH